jgi:aspartate/methionine/tyrosine aminotransferase
MTSQPGEFVYLNWIKARCASARVNLSGSGMPPPDDRTVPLSAAPRALDIADVKGFQPLFSRSAAHVGVEPSRVLAVPGCTYAMHLAIRATLTPEDEALVETPTYELLPRVLEAHGIRAIPFPRRQDAGFEIDQDALRSRITQKTRAIVITSPHNPSGRLLDDRAIEALEAIASDHDLHVVVDEVYLDFHPRERRSYPSLAARSPRFVAASSLTKAHGLSALRLGWLAGPEPIIARAWRWQEILADRVPALDAQAGCVAFDHMGAMLARARSAYETGFGLLHAAARRGGFDVIDPGAGITALVRAPAGVDTRLVADRLYEKAGVLVPPGEMFGAPGFLRVSWGVPESTLREGLDSLFAALSRPGGS